MQTKGFILRRFRKLRLQAGYTQQELADEASIELRAVINIEKGHGCYRKTLERCAKALGKEPHVFLQEAS